MKRGHSVSKPLGIAAICFSLGLVACGGSQGGSPNEQVASTAGGGGNSSGLPDPNAKFATLPPIDPSQGFQVDEGQFQVQPGEDITYCIRIPVPSELVGKDLGLIGWDWDLPQYTHHFFMAYSDAPADFGGKDYIPCDGVDPIVDNATLPSLGSLGTGGALPDAGATSTVPNEVLPGAAPAGNGLSKVGEGKLIFGAGVGTGRYLGNERYGRILQAGGHLVTNHHVLNTSAEVVSMHGKFNMYVREASKIPHPTNELNCLTLDVGIQPKSQRIVTATCTAPFDLDIVLLASHGHNHLKLFETRLFDGEKTLPDPIYTSDEWNSPILAWQKEPLHLKKGQGLTFSCHYQNDGDTTITFGTNVTNEMCATMNAYALPDDQEYGKTPPLGTVITNNDANTCLTIDLQTNQVKQAPNCDVQDTTVSPIPFF